MINKHFKLPAVLAISILLMLAEIAGSFISKNLFLLSYAGLILAISFSALPSILNKNINNKNEEAFKRSQFYSICINSAMLLIIAIYIIYKSFILFFDPRGINPALSCWMAFTAFITIIPCLMILFPEIKKDSILKKLFFKFLFCLILAPILLLSSIAYYVKDMYFLEPATSIFIAVFIIIQSALLFKDAFFILIEK